MPQEAVCWLAPVRVRHAETWDVGCVGSVTVTVISCGDRQSPAKDKAGRGVPNAVLPIPLLRSRVHPALSLCANSTPLYHVRLAYATYTRPGLSDGVCNCKREKRGSAAEQREAVSAGAHIYCIVRWVRVTVRGATGGRRGWQN